MVSTVSDYSLLSYVNRGVSPFLSDTVYTELFSGISTHLHFRNAY